MGSTRQCTWGWNDSICKLTGIFSMSLRRMPMVIVVVLLGHDPHAPWSFKYTTGPSISDNSTFPPSDIKYGRICKHNSYCAVLQYVDHTGCANTGILTMVIISYLIKHSFYIFCSQL